MSALQLPTLLLVLQLTYQHISHSPYLLCSDHTLRNLLILSGSPLRLSALFFDKRFNTLYFTVQGKLIFDSVSSPFCQPIIQKSKIFFKLISALIHLTVLHSQTFAADLTFIV